MALWYTLVLTLTNLFTLPQNYLPKWSLIKPRKYTNNNDGFFMLLSILSSFDKDSIIIVLESTVHYGNNLLMLLVPKWYKAVIINPIHTSILWKNNIHRTKTDNVNTFIISKALIMNKHWFITIQNLALMPLNILCLFRQNIVKKRTGLKIQLT